MDESHATSRGDGRGRGADGSTTTSGATAPDPEVPAKAQRRRFTAEYRLRILKQASADGSNPAISGHRKPGHFRRPETATRRSNADPAFCRLSTTSIRTCHRFQPFPVEDDTSTPYVSLSRCGAQGAVVNARSGRLHSLCTSWHRTCVHVLRQVLALSIGDTASWGPPRSRSMSCLTQLFRRKCRSRKPQTPSSMLHGDTQLISIGASRTTDRASAPSGRYSAPPRTLAA